VARVLLSGALRRHAGGRAELSIEAPTYRELVAALEARFPGIAPRQRSGLGITLFFVINWVLSRRYRDSHGITVRNVTGLSEVALGAAPARLCDRDRRRGSRFGGGS